MQYDVDVEDYWTRENTWLVMHQKDGVCGWQSTHETKACAIAAAKQWIADARPDAVWVVKSPFFASCE